MQEDSLPRLLNLPRPNYTLDVRKNKVVGAIYVRVLINIDGRVKNEVCIWRLPDGLDEQAIRAAYQMRLKPAMKGSRTMVFWIKVEIVFTMRYGRRVKALFPIKVRNNNGVSLFLPTSEGVLLIYAG